TARFHRHRLCPRPSTDPIRICQPLLHKPISGLIMAKRTKMAIDITRVQAMHLVQHFGGIRDAALSSATNNWFDVYVLRDGRALLICAYDDKAVAYESVNDLRYTIASGRQGAQSGHILRGLLPFGSDFPAHIEQMISEVASMLGIERTALDFSRDSARRIDR